MTSYPTDTLSRHVPCYKNQIDAFVEELGRIQKYAGPMRIVLSGDLSSSRAIKAVADLLATAPGIVDMDVGTTRCTPPGATLIADALRRSSSSLLSFSANSNRNLDVKAAAALAAAAGAQPSLEDLDLSMCWLHLGGALAIGKAIEQSNNLQRVLVNACGIEHKGAAAIANGIRASTSLQILCLDNNPMGDDGAAAILNSIQQCPSMKNILLSDVHGGDEMARAMARCLGPDSRCRLQIINVNGNLIGSDAADALADAIATNDSLQSLFCSATLRTLESRQRMREAIQAVRQRRSFYFKARDMDVPPRNEDLEGFSSWRQRAVVLHRRVHAARRDAGRMGRAAAEGRPLELGKRVRLGALGGGLRARVRVGVDGRMKSRLGLEGCSALLCDPLCGACVGGHADCVGVLLDGVVSLGDGTRGLWGLQDGAWGMGADGSGPVGRGMSCVDVCMRLVGAAGYEGVCSCVGRWVGQVRAGVSKLREQWRGVRDRAMHARQKASELREGLGADAHAREQAAREACLAQSRKLCEMSGNDEEDERRGKKYGWQLQEADEEFEMQERAWNKLVAARLGAEEAQQQARVCEQEAARVWEGVRASVDGVRRVLVEGQGGARCGGSVGSCGGGEGAIGLWDVALGEGAGAGLLDAALGALERGLCGDGVDWAVACETARVHEWAVCEAVDVEALFLASKEGGGACRK